MKTRAVFGSILVAAVAWLGLSTPAFATVQTIDLGTVYTGYTPDGAPWWLQATFTYDGSSDTGTLDLTANLQDADFVGSGGFNGLGFNLAGNTLSSVSFVSGTQASSVNTNSYTAPPAGMGTFNLNFQWNAMNRFNGSDTAEYTLTFADMLTASPFVANADGWTAYAHVQGITNAAGGATCSGWIVNDDGTGTVGAQSGMCGGTTHNVPEPGVLGMFGLGVLLIGGFLGWRRRYYS